MNPKAIVVLVSHPVDGSHELARHIIEARLAACAQVLPPMTSIYLWQSKIEQEAECLILLKSFDTLWDDLQHFIKTHHPYTVPEILAWGCSQVNEPYLQWMRDSLNRESSE